MGNKQAIQMKSATEFTLSARGCNYTLKLENGRWAMYVVNAAVRAWNLGFATPKYFYNLEAVEAKYKAWSGITKLVADSPKTQLTIGGQQEQDYKDTDVEHPCQQASKH